MEAKIKLLKKIHQRIIDIGDEELYEWWIWLFPDEPQESDFEYISSDEKLYNECLERFIYILFESEKN